MTPIKKNIYGLLLVFLVPMITGFLLFENAERLGILGNSVNYGKLIQPITTINNLDYIDKETITDPQDSRKWIYLAIADELCYQECLDRIEDIKKIRLFTNEKMQRVRSTVITPNTIKGYKSNHFFSLKVDSDGSLLAPFKQYRQESIYLIDPMGNIMMEYEKVDLNRMLEDIKRLLKYSRIG